MKMMNKLNMLSIFINFLSMNVRKCRKLWMTLRNAPLSWKVKLKIHQSSLLCLRWIGSPHYCTTIQGLSRWDNEIETIIMLQLFRQNSCQWDIGDVDNFMWPGKAIFQVMIIRLIIKLWWCFLELENQWHFTKVWMLRLNIKPVLPLQLRCDQVI